MSRYKFTLREPSCTPKPPKSEWMLALHRTHTMYKWLRDDIRAGPVVVHSPAYHTAAIHDTLLCWIVDHVKSTPGACVYVPLMWSDAFSAAAWDVRVSTHAQNRSDGGCASWFDAARTGKFFALEHGALPTIEIRLADWAIRHVLVDTFQFEVVRHSGPFDARPYKEALDPHLIPDLANLVADYLAPVGTASEPTHVWCM